MQIRRALTTVVTLTALVAGAVPAVAQVQAQDDACPSARVPATAFTDTVRSTHRAAIDCAAWWGITTGRTRSSFAPGGDITRGQASAMIARLLRETGAGGSPAPSAGFTDTSGHRFEADIDLLASLGIVFGVTSTRFRPDQAIDRAQMASVVARTFERGLDSPLPPATEPFADVSSGNVHRATIGSVTAAGIATGTSATTFAPRDPVARAQMASFLTRSASRMVAQGMASPPTGNPDADDVYHSRTRGAWVHLFDGALKTRARIEALVDELADADATTIIAQVARRHDAYYDSDVLPRTPDPGVAADFDVLATLLEVAHARGLEVHAWLAVAPTTHEVYDALPDPPGWVASTHGRTAPVADRWVTRTRDGAWSDYLDPGVLAVQDHVAAVVGELAARYDIDGIHLDYVRYQSAEHGYHPQAVARFNASAGRTGTPAATDPAWMQWRRSQTEQVMRRAGQAIEVSGNDVELSAAVITWADGPPTLDRAGFRATMPYTRTLQDWDGWVRGGLVDAVYPMNYYRAADATQARQFARWLEYEQRLARDATPRVVPGPAGYLNRPTAVLDQVEAAMRRGDGAMIYSYQQPTLDGSREVLDQLAQRRWSYPPAP